MFPLYLHGMKKQLQASVYHCKFVMYVASFTQQEIALGPSRKKESTRFSFAFSYILRFRHKVLCVSLRLLLGRPFPCGDIGTKCIIWFSVSFIVIVGRFLLSSFISRHQQYHHYYYHTINSATTIPLSLYHHHHCTTITWPLPYHHYLHHTTSTIPITIPLYHHDHRTTIATTIPPAIALNLHHTTTLTIIPQPPYHYQNYHTTTTVPSLPPLSVL